MSNKVLNLRAIAVAGLLLISQAGCIWLDVTSGEQAAFARRAQTHTQTSRSTKKTAKSHVRSSSSRGRVKSFQRRSPRSGRKNTRTVRSARGRHHGTTRSAHRAHAQRVNHAQRGQTKFVAPPDAGGPVDFGIAPRARNYALLSRAYALYDQGVNEKLRGNYGAATDKLAESVSLIDQARSNQHNGVPSTLESMVFFELGEAAEADGDFTLARDSYAHCLRAKANFVEGYLHIVNLLATQGQLPLAANWLKEGLQECPHDARINELSTQLSTYIGSTGTDLVVPAKTMQGPQEPESSGE